MVVKRFDASQHIRNAAHFQIISAQNMRSHQAIFKKTKELLGDKFWSTRLSSFWSASFMYPICPCNRTSSQPTDELNTWTRPLGRDPGFLQVPNKRKKVSVVLCIVRTVNWILPEDVKHIFKESTPERIHEILNSEITMHAYRSEWFRWLFLGLRGGLPHAPASSRSWDFLSQRMKRMRKVWSRLSFWRAKDT